MLKIEQIRTQQIKERKSCFRKCSSCGSCVNHGSCGFLKCLRCEPEIRCFCMNGFRVWYDTNGYICHRKFDEGDVVHRNRSCVFAGRTNFYSRDVTGQKEKFARMRG